MSDSRDDYRATIEDAAADAQEIVDIEAAKADLDPADPRARSLAREAEDLAEGLRHKTRVERDITDEAAEPG